MKTTIEISDALLKAAKRSARARGLTLRALVEEGLRRVLREDAAPQQFRLRRASFKGTGKSVEARDWESVRELIYGDVGA
ncbi:MAG: type II toxin-antitoxin system VapB family antitoxin [Gemmatimonadota bacterium]